MLQTLGLGIFICLLIQLFMSADKQRGTVYIYCVLTCGITALLGGLFTLFHAYSIEIKDLVYIGGSVIIQGIVGGAIALRLGLLLFRKKIQKK